MHARTTTIHGNPAAVDEGIAYVENEVMPALLKLDGYIGLSLLADRQSGRCIATAAWRDEQSMKASGFDVRWMLDRAAERFGGLPEVEEWEIAVMHRKRRSCDGAGTRVTWTRGDPAQLDRIIDSYRLVLLPQFDEMPGFCSASLLVNRETGRMSSSYTVDRRVALEETRERSAALREQFIRELGVDVTDITEFDLALAHLRVPETV